MTHLAVLLTVALAQAPAETPAPDRVEQAVQAAQKAAEAAEKAAVAAQKAAEAAAAAVAPKAPAEIPTTPSPPAPGEKKDTWRGLVGVGLIAITGNAETLTGTANAQADRS